MDFDYTPLSRKITARELLVAFKQSSIGLIGVVGLVALMIIPVLMAAAIGFTGESLAGVMGIFIVATLFISFPVAVFLAKVMEDVKGSLRLNEFAKINGLETFAGNDATIDFYQGVMLQQSNVHYVAGGFRLQGLQSFDIANLTIRKGGANAARGDEVHSFGTIRMKLPKELPSMLLDATSNNQWRGRVSNLPVNVDRNRRLSLEGNFDKFFTLYAQPAYKVDALYVFTPDVMQYFIDNLLMYDVELCGDNLYLYQQNGFDFKKKGVLEAAVRRAEGLHKIMYDRTYRYSAQRTIDSSNTTLTHRLRIRVGLIGGLFIIALVLFIIDNVSGS